MPFDIEYQVFFPCGVEKNGLSGRRFVDFVASYLRRFVFRELSRAHYSGFVEVLCVGGANGGGIFGKIQKKEGDNLPPSIKDFLLKIRHLLKPRQVLR